MDLLKTVILIGIVVAALGLVYVFVFLPWQLRRGAANVNLQRTLPGDELVTNPKTGYTQAITISAPKAEVWQWLVQIGYKQSQSGSPGQAVISGFYRTDFQFFFSIIFAASAIIRLLTCAGRRAIVFFAFSAAVTAFSI